MCLVFGASAVVVKNPAGPGQPESSMGAACALPNQEFLLRLGGGAA
jgi:hypothetical protein